MWCRTFANGGHEAEAVKPAPAANGSSLQSRQRSLIRWKTGLPSGGLFAVGSCSGAASCASRFPLPVTLVEERIEYAVGVAWKQVVLFQSQAHQAAKFTAPARIVWWAEF